MIIFEEHIDTWHLFAHKSTFKDNTAKDKNIFQ